MGKTRKPITGGASGLSAAITAGMKKYKDNYKYHALRPDEGSSTLENAQKMADQFKNAGGFGGGASAIASSIKLPKSKIARDITRTKRNKLKSRVKSKSKMKKF